MRKSLFNRAAGILAAVLVLFTVSAFTSCTITVVDGYTAEDLNGTWTCTYSTGYVESYTINTTAATFDAGSSSYAGDNMVINFEGEDYGTIYFIYTRSMNADYTYSTTAPDVGKWYAVSFKNLTSTSVDLSGAYLSTGVTSAGSLEDAKAIFTVDNGYFSNYSSLTLSE